MKNQATTELIQNGLSSKLVEQKKSEGKVNVPVKSLTRSVGQIISENTLTLFNAINLFFAILVAITGKYANLWFLGPVLFNTVIGIFQELRAKRQVDAMSLITMQQITVKRDGKSIQLSQDELVEGDIVTLKRGNEIPADGIVLQTNGLEVDESPLTGESRNIIKKDQDEVLSGSFINSGQAIVQLTKVGHESFISKLSLEAKTEKKPSSQLLNMINKIIRILTYIIIPLGIILAISSYLKGGGYIQIILGTATAVIGMIPEGLVLLTSVALAVGSLNLSRKKVLTRSINAIESLARIDTLCLDKTGTITTGNLHIHEIEPVADLTKEELIDQTQAIVTANQDDNATARVILGYTKTPTTKEASATLPFSSDRKMSGASFTDKPDEFWLMGAPEFIFKNQKLPIDVAEKIAQATADGFRIILIAKGTGDLKKLDDASLKPMGWLKIADEVRPSAKQTFNYLAEQGIDLKVISGDNPVTVSNVAQRAGIKGAKDYVDMSQQTDNVDFTYLVQNYNIFGRVSPTQKRNLIKSYQKLGKTVGMTGDGVNDVLALKQSDCAIAVAGGNDASQSVADFVLLNANFDNMIHILNEGRRVINNIERVASMYLNKTIYSIILAVIFIFVNLQYPFHLSQLTPATMLTVGIPSFFLALEPDFSRPTGRFMDNVLSIAAPAAFSIVTYVIIFSFLQSYAQVPFADSSTMVSLMITVIGFITLLYLSKPLTPIKYGLLSLVVIGIIISYGFLGNLFELTSIFSFDLAIWYIPLILTAWPLFVLYRIIFKKLNNYYISKPEA
ncbi:HAD-IC family P-type ATPase [Holzapfeliella sp. JNUCC 72]